MNGKHGRELPNFTSDLLSSDIYPVGHDAWFKMPVPILYEILQ
jgi:hypothetical protein